MSDTQISMENGRLKVEVEHYRKLLAEQEEKYRNEIQELKDEHNNEIEILRAEIKKLESKINLQTKKRQISDEEVKRIKDLRASGMSYSKIEKETGWSSVTINRAIKGVYD